MQILCKSLVNLQVWCANLQVWARIFGSYVLEPYRADSVQNSRAACSWVVKKIVVRNFRVSAWFSRYRPRSTSEIPRLAFRTRLARLPSPPGHQ